MMKHKYRSELVVAITLLASCRTTAAKLQVSGGQPTNLFTSVVSIRYYDTSPEGQEVHAGSGSGVLVPGGFILTNAHIIQSLRRRTGPLRIFLGNQNILVEERLQGFETGTPSLYHPNLARKLNSAADFSERTFIYDFGYLKPLGDQVYRTDLGLNAIGISSEPVKRGDRLTVVACGPGDSPDWQTTDLIRRSATFTVAQTVGPASLVITGMPLADGRAPCVYALCQRYTDTDPYDPSKGSTPRTQAGDSGGAAIGSDGKLKAINVGGIQNSPVNFAINLSAPMVNNWFRSVGVFAGGYDRAIKDSGQPDLSSGFARAPDGSLYVPDVVRTSAAVDNSKLMVIYPPPADAVTAAVRGAPEETVIDPALMAVVQQDPNIVDDATGQDVVKIVGNQLDSAVGQATLEHLINSSNTEGSASTTGSAAADTPATDDPVDSDRDGSRDGSGSSGRGKGAR